MKITVLSGKGGTGKTTITSAFSELWEDDICRIDCDVDASNMHLMLSHRLQNKYDFKGAKLASIDQTLCTQCQACIKVCQFDALHVLDKVTVNDLLCEGCGACRWVCPVQAISLKDEITGRVMLSALESGYLSHAEMIPGQEDSGKLVSEVRKQGDKTERKHQLLDGSPGIGCSVIASMTGTDVVVVVTEPTISGLEDMKRVITLIKHFQIQSYVLINKYDINQEMTKSIEKYCDEVDVEVIGRIPFDALVKTSINSGTPIIYYEDSLAGLAIREGFNVLKERINI